VTLTGEALSEEAKEPFGEQAQLESGAGDGRDRRGRRGKGHDRRRAGEEGV